MSIQIEEVNRVHGLNYDFIRRNGNFIVFSKEIGLCEMDLNPLQLQMLQRYSIPQLLPFVKEEMNGIVRMLYQFTEKKMLTYELRINRLELNNYYKLLHSIIGTIIDNQKYFLDDQGYVLKEHFIFIGSSFDDVNLCYLPLQKLENKESVQTELNNLALNLVTYVENIEGQGIQKLIKMLQTTEYSLLELKSLLFKLMNEKNEEENQVKLEHENKDKYESEAVIEHFPIKFGLGNFQYQIPTPFKKAMSHVLGILSIVVIVFIFMSNPSEGLLYICLGLIILTINAQYVIQRLWNPIDRKVKVSSVLGWKEEQLVELYKDQEDPDHTENSNSYYKLLSHHTTLLHKQDATVFLNSGVSVSDKVEMNSYLELTQNGTMIKIELIKEPFVIGRADEGVHYQLIAVGVSRLHCELFCVSNEWFLKDLGSSNGTELNEEKLIPYKVYALHTGDKIKIVQSEFVFICCKDNKNNLN